MRLNPMAPVSMSRIPMSRIAGLVLPALLIAATTGVAAADVKVGQEAPDFTVTSDKGPLTLSSFEGKSNVVLIFSRANWCPFCTAHITAMNKQYSEFKKAGAEVVVIYREEDKGLAGLKLIRKKTGAAFPMGLDLNKKKTSEYSSSGFSSYVIDKKGVVQKAITGSVRSRPKPADLLAALKAL